MTTLNLTVADGLGDVHEEEQDGDVFDDAALQRIFDQASNSRRWGAWRWTSGSMPAQGCTIDAAIMQVYVDSGSADDPHCHIYADDVPSPAVFDIGSTTFDVTNRTPTTAKVEWIADGIGFGWKTLPSLQPVIAEIVADHTITAIVLVAKPGTISGEHLFRSVNLRPYNVGAIYAAKLDIDYSIPDVIVTPPTATLVLTEFAPTILLPQLVTPSTLALSLTEFAPVVTTPRLVVPPTLALILTEFAPTIKIGADIVVIPGVLAQTLGLFAPTVVLSTYVAYGAPFLYTVANWGSELAFYLEVYVKATSGIARARLWNDTDGAVVADSELNTAAASYTRLRSGALSLIDGKTYVVQFGTEDGTAGEFKHGKIVAF